MPSNHTWICFDCRHAIRQPSWPARAAAPTCPRCAKACVYLGHKIPVPPKRDARAWTALREQLQRGAVEFAVWRHKNQVRRRHYLERRIADLRSRPTSTGLSKEIKLLQKELQELASRTT